LFEEGLIQYDFYWEESDARSSGGMEVEKGQPTLVGDVINNALFHFALLCALYILKLCVSLP